MWSVISHKLSIGPPASSWFRTYAQISHVNPVVHPDYDLPPRSLVAWTRPTTAVGSSYVKKARKQEKARIPGVLLRGSQDPLFLSISPHPIQLLLRRSHFLGRRYKLTIDSKEELLVYPTHLEVQPVNMFPMSVCFSIWKDNPRLVWSLEERPKFRPYEKDSVNAIRLSDKLERMAQWSRNEARKIEKFEMTGYEETLKFYETKVKKERFIHLEEEMEKTIDEWSKTPGIVVLEKEEFHRDEVIEWKEEDEA